ncbi:MAG: hypothetical protein BWX58_00654 [Deltaproteobacteria bacterium ADurb.Bin026]|nr:MAG: hypothetical protein BWX58_00654 [Deltaproteobacteria bacterium ADurb.Bin026]
MSMQPKSEAHVPGANGIYPTNPQETMKRKIGCE